MRDLACFERLAPFVWWSIVMPFPFLRHRYGNPKVLAEMPPLPVPLLRYRTERSRRSNASFAYYDTGVT